MENKSLAEVNNSFKGGIMKSNIVDNYINVKKEVEILYSKLQDLVKNETLTLDEKFKMIDFAYDEIREINLNFEECMKVI